MMRFRSVLISFCFVSVLTGCLPLRHVEETPLSKSKDAMVVSAHPLATDVGVMMLQKGGNAVDAAVATAFVISVVEPFSAGIGGGGFLLLREGKTGKIHALDFRERAPQRATRNMYLDKEGKVQPRASLDGYQAVAIPGTVAGLYTLHRYYGKLSWADVVAPSIAFAKNGFPVSSRFAIFSDFRWNTIKKNPPAFAIFSRDGKMFKPGEILIQKDLAKSLEQIARDPLSFYQGNIAKMIAADMAKNGGLITLKDLREYTPIWRHPLCGNFRQYQVCSMPPPSSGGVALLEMLNMIGDRDLKAWGRQNPDTIHLLAGAMQIAYADRAEYLGDPAFVKVPVSALTNPAYGAKRGAEINLKRAIPSSDVKYYDPKTLSDYHKESPETTHLTVVDGARNTVSLTFTVNGGFGAGVVAQGTGILLNNEMDDFASAIASPNLYKLVGGEANSIAPGKTPLSSMTPTIITENNQLRLAMGSPGGSTIITTVLQLLLNVLVYDMNAGEAVSASRFHHQWLPDELRVENDSLETNTLRVLKQQGYDIKEMNPWGNANLIRVTPDNQLEGAADPRGEGTAKGIDYR